jgi:hypothetical protein
MGKFHLHLVLRKSFIHLFQFRDYSSTKCNYARYEVILCFSGSPIFFKKAKKSDKDEITRFAAVKPDHM